MNVKKVMSLVVVTSMATMAFAQTMAVTPNPENPKIVAKKTAKGFSSSIKDLMEKTRAASQTTGEDQQKEEISKMIQGGKKIVSTEQKSTVRTDKLVKTEEENTIDEEKVVTDGQAIADDQAIATDGQNVTDDTFNPNRERNNNGKKINARDLKGDDNGAPKGEPTPSLDERAVADSVTNAVTKAGAAMTDGVKVARDIIGGVKGLVAKGLSFDDFE